ncbi:MAG: hypothetical protein GTO40_19950, partial [Deltaproteobacteria bacterium]|nr:hypothetical protein [Deltaproteobacteria bacterium]
LDLQELQTSHLTIVDLSHVADPETITGVTRTVSKLKMPILWLAGEGAPGCPDGEHFHSMLLPVEREILQEVLNQLLANTAEGGKERGDHQ